jgi:hypothetical protein
MKRNHNLILASAVLACAAPAAFAADRRVGPGEQYETIQAAADAANPGDRIVLGARTYVENVSVTKERLVFLGTSGTIWDGTIDASTSGTCLTVSGDGTVVQGIAFRAGFGHVDLTGAGVRVVKCESLRAGGTAIRVVGARARVDSCAVRGSIRNAIELSSADDAIVTRCRIVGAGSYGIFVTGPGATASSNTVLTSDSAAIYLFGEGASALSNTVSASGSYGVQLDGAGATASGNRVSYCDNEGVYVSGDDARVERNSVLGVLDTGVAVYGDRMFVSRNRVAQAIDDSDGYELRTNSEAGGGRVERNLAVDIVQYGFDFSTNNVSYLANKAIRCGTEDEYGFSVSGSGNKLTSCVAQECDSRGFYVSGDRNVLTKCSAIASTSAGFVVNGSDNELISCTASRNEAEGLANHGTNTDVVGGSYLGNRLDISRGETATWDRFLKPRFVTGGKDAIAEQE